MTISSAILGDFYTLQRGTTYKGKLKGFPGPVLLGLASIRRNGGFRTDKLKTYGGDSPDNLLVRAGELFASLKDVTQAGDLLGSVARMPKDVGVGRLTQDTVRLIPKQSNTPHSYLYWLLRTPQTRALCRSQATGTTNLGLARKDFLSIPVPDYNDDRRSLVTLLDRLDDKIELNRKMNQTLEEMAQAIFKSWFVDFDGCDDLVESELGLIPRGWKVEPIANIINIISGGTPKRSTPRYWNGDVPWFTVKDAPKSSGVFVVETEQHITAEGLAGSAARLVPPWTTIISARGTVGKLAVTGKEMAFNQSCYGVRSSKGHGEIFVHFSLKGVVEHLQSNAHGSVFDTITRNTFKTASVVVPPVEKAQAFDLPARPLLKKILVHRQQSRTLAALRDALLPKLISGELRVPEAEGQVKDAMEAESGPKGSDESGQLSLI